MSTRASLDLGMQAADPASAAIADDAGTLSGCSAGCSQARTETPRRAGRAQQRLDVGLASKKSTAVDSSPTALATLVRGEAGDDRNLLERGVEPKLTPDSTAVRELLPPLVLISARTGLAQ